MTLERVHTSVEMVDITLMMTYAILAREGFIERADTTLVSTDTILERTDITLKRLIPP